MVRSLAEITPAGPDATAKRSIAAAVDAARDEILDLSHRIHAHPEVAFEEEQASAWVADVLARHGFTVERPAGRLPTAVRAIRRGGRGGATPRIGILAEYDALPGLGHGCGHNTMAASGVGAAIALGAIADELPGEIVFFGTPAAAKKPRLTRRSRASITGESTGWPAPGGSVTGATPNLSCGPKRAVVTARQPRGPVGQPRRGRR